MLRRFAAWPHCVVAGFDDRLAQRIYHERTERMPTVSAGFSC
jgi:hypothetical protein